MKKIYNRNTDILNMIYLKHAFIILKKNLSQV